MKEVNDADSLPCPLLLLSLADGAIAGVAAGCRSHRSSVCRVGIGSGKEHAVGHVEDVDAEDEIRLLNEREAILQ